MVKAILEIVGSSVDLAKEIAKGKNSKESRKYLDSYIEAEQKAIASEEAVEHEKAKPADQQFSNVIEAYEKAQKHWERQLKLFQDAAKLDYQNQQAGK